MSQLLCTAVDLLTKVFPFTSNGLVASPELVMAGAAMPPRADGSATGLIATREAVEVGDGRIDERDIVDEGRIEVSGVADGASTETVLVTREQVGSAELVWTAKSAVGLGASTVTKPVTIEHKLSVFEGLVATARLSADVLAAMVVVRVTAERTEPVMEAVGGIVAVAVRVPGVLSVAEAVDAMEEH
jgi:hypothetical protein